LVHRVIKAILLSQRYQLPALPTPGEAHAKLSKRLASRVKPPSDKPVKKPSVDTLAWQAAGLHCSANERRADEASRDVEAWLKCKYMREHLGEQFSGVVTSATSFGLFVTLDAMYVEGLVHITELGGEYFRFDEARQELRGERTGIRYALGSRVDVQVSRVDLDGRRIDFRLVTDGELAPPRKSGPKSAPSKDEPTGADTARARKPRSEVSGKPSKSNKTKATDRPAKSSGAKVKKPRR
jgi:ribonuclease R